VMTRVFGARARCRWLSRYSPSQLIIDVKSDDVVEVALDELESKRLRSCGVEVARPTLHDARYDSIGLAPDPRRHAVADDAAQRRDLLGDRDRQSRHGEVAAVGEAAGVDGRGVDQEANGRARGGVPVAH